MMTFRLIRIGRGKQAPKKIKACDRCGMEIYDYRYEIWPGEDNKKKYNLCTECVFERFSDAEKMLKGGFGFLAKFFAKKYFKQY